MAKPYKHISKEEFEKLSTKERQDYRAAEKKFYSDNAKLIALALRKGIEEKVKTL